MHSTARVCYGLWHDYTVSGDRLVCGSPKGPGANLTTENTGQDPLTVMTSHACVTVLQSN